MLKTKRKRAVVMALIAFFCTAATTYVAVDWKRFGGGFLAFLRGEGETRLATGGSGRSSGPGARFEDVGGGNASSPSLPQVAAARSHRRHLADAAGVVGGHKSDDDLFKYGDPAAGGIPAGSFIVAKNDVPGDVVNDGGAGSSPAPESGPGVSSPAPAPATGGGGGGGDTGLAITRTPASSPPPSSSPPSPAAPTPPAPPPSQSGTTDSDPPPPPPPVSPMPPVSAVPEASSLAMMSLGALFLAVAAQRRRKKG